MWGIRTLSTTAILDALLIPAHAGNTSRSFFLNSCSWTHPRARGEYSLLKVLNHYGKGSSPRTRGIQIKSVFSQTIKGLIPAHAGNTFAVHLLAWCAGAHPRARGEYVVTITSEPGSTGSSPRTRGIHLLTSTAITIIHVFHLTCQNQLTLVGKKYFFVYII